MKITDDLLLKVYHPDSIGFVGDKNSRMLDMAILKRGIIQKDEFAHIRVNCVRPDFYIETITQAQDPDGHYRITLPPILFKHDGKFTVEIALIKNKNLKVMGKRHYVIEDTRFYNSDMSGLSEPYWVKQSRKVEIPITTVTKEEPDLLVSKSYTTPGTAGYTIYEWTAEYVDGEPTGNTTAEVQTTQVPMVQAVYHKGMKPDPVTTWIPKSSTEVIPYQTKTVNDPTILPGESYLEAGSEGEKKITWEAEAIDGVETGKIRNLQTVIVKPAIDAIKHNGTKVEQTTYTYLAGDRAQLLSTVSGYNTAYDAQNNVNPIRTMATGTYYVYTVWENALNISTTATTPGAWVLNGPHLKKI